MNDLTKRLQDNMNLQQRLLGELKKSFRIQEFMPDAFDYGAVGVGGKSDNGYRISTAEIWFVLGNGEKRVFPATEVPRDLWPESMQTLFPCRPATRSPRALRAQQRSGFRNLNLP